MSWLAEGDKYALVGLQVKLEGPNPPEQIGNNIWVRIDYGFHISSRWREWLGTIRSNQLADCNLFLISKMQSDRPGIVDDEDVALQLRATQFYTGLLLAAMFSPSHEPVMLSGAMREGEIDVRQKYDFDIPLPQTARPYPPIFSRDIILAARICEKLALMSTKEHSVNMWRFFRTLDIYLRARTIPLILDRIHQYCRCIEGLILPKSGDTKRQFKSRTELFVGPKHHDFFGELYDIRSNVEHLHESRYVEGFDREVRLDLLRKEIVAEYIVRKTISKILIDDKLWRYFGNNVALQSFWELPSDERREIWGTEMDPFQPLNTLNLSLLHDGHLK
jgi:hypothetical protein